MAFHINSQNTKGGITKYNVGNSVPDLGCSQTFGGVKPVNVKYTQ